MELFSKEHKLATWGTILLHAGLLCLLMFLGFYTKLPLPEEEGIEVNFGNSSAGMGRHEPQASSIINQAVPKPSELEPPPSVPISAPPITNSQTTPVETKPTNDKGAENIMTQDYEESVAIAQKQKEEEQKRKEKESEQKRIAEAKKQKEEQDKTEELKRRQEQEAKRIIEEQARIRKEAELRRLKIEEEKRKKEQEQRQIAEINNRVLNAFGNKTNTATGGGSETSVSGSQGISNGDGNQGVPTGSPDSDNYSAGGGSGKGISYNLGNRKALALPKPSYPGKEQETVVVEVSVDKGGTVVEANPGAQGSTTMNSQLLSVAKKAALASKFTADNSAPARQKGTITYIFILK
ncbi:MAG: hypothetical protein ACK5MG_07885 [Bacteroidales bacterium]